MNDLVEFLRARLDEDESAARTASPSPWKDPEEDEADDLWLTREDAYHIYRWEPARVLREVEAKRKLIDRLVASMEEDYAPWNEDNLRCLAEVYADHPSYRQEWKPQIS